MYYHIITSDPAYLQEFIALRDLAIQRIVFFQKKARELGFDEIGMEDFDALPRDFYKKRADDDMSRKGPAIGGFKGGKLSYQSSGYYFVYSLKATEKTLAQQLREGVPDVPSECKDMREFRRYNVASVIAKRHGLPNGVFDNNRIQFIVANLLHDKTVLALTVPFREDGSREDQPAVIPKGFTEITERAMHAEFAKHNAALEKNKT